MTAKSLVPVRALLYVRVGAAQVTEPVGMQQMLQQCREFAEAKGWTVLDEAWDIGSGNKLLPGFGRILKQARENYVDVLVAPDLHAITRSASILDDLLSTGVHLVLLDRPETHSMDSVSRMAVKLMTAFAEAEKAQHDARAAANAERGVPYDPDQD